MNWRKLKKWKIKFDRYYFIYKTGNKKKDKGNDFERFKKIRSSKENFITIFYH